MISNLVIKGFKGFKEIDFNLSRMTLIGGKNGIGKTNILEALFLIHDRVNPSMFLRLHNFRGIQEVFIEPMNMWGPFFNNYNINERIDITITNNGNKEQMLVRFVSKGKEYSVLPIDNQEKTLRVKTVQKPFDSKYLEVRYKTEDKKDQVINLALSPKGLEVEQKRTYPSTEIVPAVFHSSIFRVDPMEDANRFGQLDIEGKGHEVVKYLNIIDPNIKSVTVITVGNKPILHADIGIGRKMPISFMGGGISRFLSIILSIMVRKKGIVLVDEIENGLHYSVMEKILFAIGMVAKDFDCQIICTTHSYECLKAFNKAFLNEEAKEEFCYIRLERIKGILTAVYFDIDKLGVAIEREWEVR